MELKITLPTDKLTQWHYAVNWARLVLQEKVQRFAELDVDASYDREKLEQLEDLDMFLVMSWDSHMDQICNVVQEAK